jgi:hypothetical protein
VLAVEEPFLKLTQLYPDHGYVPKSEIRHALHISVAVLVKPAVLSQALTEEGSFPVQT